MVAYGSLILSIHLSSLTQYFKVRQTVLKRAWRVVGRLRGARELLLHRKLA
jgi:hypothetical protein